MLQTIADSVLKQASEMGLVVLVPDKSLLVIHAWMDGMCTFNEFAFYLRNRNTTFFYLFEP